MVRRRSYRSAGFKVGQLVASGLAILSAMLGCLIYSGPVASFAKRFRGRSQVALLRAPYLILSMLCWAGLAASAVFVVASLYALATGWALPTTALIRWSPVAEWAANNEPYFVPATDALRLRRCNDVARRLELTSSAEHGIGRTVAATASRVVDFRLPRALSYFASAQCGQELSDREIRTTRTLAR